MCLTMPGVPAAISTWQASFMQYTPPFDKVGVIDLETFYPARQRLP